MMPDAPGIAHARTRDDDVKAFGFGDAAARFPTFRWADQVGTQGTTHGVTVFQCCGMLQKHFRRADRKRAVHENRHLWNGASLHQRHQIPADFLSAFHRKGRDQQHTIRLRRFLHNGCKLCPPRHMVHAGLFLIAIGAFHEHMIQRGWRFRFMMKHRTIRPQITRDQHAHRRILAISAFDFDRGRAEHMPCIPPACPHPRHGFYPVPKRHHTKGRKHRRRILHRIDRLYRGAPAMAVAAVELRDLHFLHMSGIRQHDSTQIRRRRRGVDHAAKTSRLQLGQQTGMVDVGMRQQHRVNFTRVEGEFLPIQGFQRLRPLEHAAIHQKAAPPRVENQAIAGNGACRAANPD